jgi:hypothetical protein
MKAGRRSVRVSGPMRTVANVAPSSLEYWTIEVSLVPASASAARQRTVTDPPTPTVAPRPGARILTVGACLLASCSVTGFPLSSTSTATAPAAGTRPLTITTGRPCSVCSSWPTAPAVAMTLPPGPRATSV